MKDQKRAASGNVKLARTFKATISPIVLVLNACTFMHISNLSEIPRFNKMISNC